MALLILCAVGFAVSSGIAALCGKALTETFSSAGKEMFESLKTKMNK